MTFPNFTYMITIQIAFVAVTVVYFGLLLKVLFAAADHLPWSQKRLRNFKVAWIGGLLVWTAFISIWSLSGLMSDFSMFPLNLAPVIALPLIAIIAITFSGPMKEVLAEAPVQSFLHLQSFRVAVEVLLWMLFLENALPVQMTFEGRNFDILAGLTGPVVGFLAARNIVGRQVLIAWNIISLGLLINIVTVAVLSTPSPLRVFMNEPANTIVATFPVVVLPGLLVPLAYMMHFFSLRQLAVKHSSRETSDAVI